MQPPSSPAHIQASAALPTQGTCTSGGRHSPWGRVHPMCRHWPPGGAHVSGHQSAAVRPHSWSRALMKVSSSAMPEGKAGSPCDRGGRTEASAAAAGPAIVIIWCTAGSWGARAAAGKKRCCSVDFSNKEMQLTGTGTQLLLYALPSSLYALGGGACGVGSARHQLPAVRTCLQLTTIRRALCS